MDYKIEVVEQEAVNALAVRTRCPVNDLPKAIGEGYGLIMGYLGELGKYPSDAPYVAYFNMDMQDLDIEMGFPVAEEIEGKGTVVKSQVPAGRYAACMYKGPYSDIGAAYDAVMLWLEENSLQYSGIAYEFYLNDPDSVPPEELLTKIMIKL